MKSLAWRISQAPLDDELLTSFLIRNAHANGLPVWRFTRIFWPKRQMWNVDLDRSCHEDLICSISSLSGVSEERIREMRLVEFVQALGDGKEEVAVRPWLLAVGCHWQYRTLHGVQYCPLCLAEDARPYFRKSWRLAFSVVCSEHHVRLRDACPRCAAPVLPHRTWPRKIDRCTTCGWMLTDTGRSAPEPPPARIEMLEDFQVALRNTIESNQGLLGDRSVSASEYFFALRLLVSAISNRPVERCLQRLFGLQPPSDRHEGEPPTGRQRLELARWEYRASVLEILARWLDGWPFSFLNGSRVAGLTQRSFRGEKNSRLAIQRELEKLPTGFPKHRDFRATRLQKRIARLKGSSLAQYRTARAKVLFAAAIRRAS